jgi:hypothetical protein
MTNEIAERFVVDPAIKETMKNSELTGLPVERRRPQRRAPGLVTSRASNGPKSNFQNEKTEQSEHEPGIEQR